MRGGAVEVVTLLHLSLAPQTLLWRGTERWNPGDTVPPPTEEVSEERKKGEMEE